MGFVMTVNGKTPVIGKRVFLAPTSAITGEVIFRDDASAFYGVSVRGDSAPIEVGIGTNLQDNAVLHADERYPCAVGDGVSVGHGAVIHGATVGQHSLVGMAATVLNDAVIGEEVLVAAGALVPQGMVIPARSLVTGVPGKVRRELSDQEVSHLHRNAAIYLELKSAHITAMEDAR